MGVLRRGLSLIYFIGIGLNRESIKSLPNWYSDNSSIFIYSNTFFNTVVPAEKLFLSFLREFDYFRSHPWHFNALLFSFVNENTYYFLFFSIYLLSLSYSNCTFSFFWVAWYTERLPFSTASSIFFRCLFLSLFIYCIRYSNTFSSAFSPSALYNSYPKLLSSDKKLRISIF